MAYLLDFKNPRFVTGYSGPEVDTALKRGEIDARSQTGDSILKQNPDWLFKEPQQSCVPTAERPFFCPTPGSIAPPPIVFLWRIMAHQRRQDLALIGFLVLVLGWLFPTPPGRTQTSPVQLRVSYAGFSVFQLPLWLLKDRGLEKKYGLEVETILVQGGAQTVQALLGRSTHLAQGAGDVTLNAALKGADIVMIAASLNRYVHSLVSRPGITTAAGLRGKKIGIARFGGMTQWVAKQGLETLGLDSKDIVFLPTGNTTERLLAMEKGLVDATVFSYPELVKIKKMGYRVLVEAASLKVFFPTSALSAKRDYLQKNREAVKNFLRTYCEAIHIIQTNRDAAKKVLSKHTRITDQDTLEQTYNFYVQMIDPIPRPDLKGIGSALEELTPEGAQRKPRPEDFVDTTLLDELEREGFFKKLISAAR